MGFSLRARNKEVGEFTIGAFVWPILLQETGAGYILGYGAGRTPASYVYQTGNNGSPSSNDGYKVTSEESKMIARVVKGFLSVQRFVNSEWENTNEIQKNHMDDTVGGRYIYRRPWNEQSLEQFERFAEFAEKSKGFTIN